MTFDDINTVLQVKRAREQRSAARAASAASAAAEAAAARSSAVAAAARHRLARSDLESAFYRTLVSKPIRSHHLRAEAAHLSRLAAVGAELETRLDDASRTATTLQKAAEQARIAAVQAAREWEAIGTLQEIFVEREAAWLEHAAELELEDSVFRFDPGRER
jgi:hypothetical protein